MTVTELLVQAIQRPLPAVDPTTALSDVPGFDSIAMVRLTLAIEARLDRELTVAEMESMATVGHVEQLLAQG